MCMTDRAACMKLYDKHLEQFLQSQLGEHVKLNFLHCNAHFLLGLSSECEKSLVSFESSLIESTTEKLGRDQSKKFSDFRESGSATNRIIRAICNLLGPRGDQKKRMPE